MSLWHRIFGWRKAEPVPFVPVYPTLPPISSGTTKVACPVSFRPEFIAGIVEQKPERKNTNRRKPWNKPRACRNIAAGVLEDMRAAGFEGACTCEEMNEWIDEHVKAHAMDIGGLTHTSIRAAIKRCIGVRFENRRLKADPAYEALRRRNIARKQFVPERAWIFIIDSEPELVEAGVQLEKRAA